jgi:hypothetical protein
MKRPDPYKGRSRGGAAQQRLPAKNPSGGEFPSQKTRRLGDVKDPYLRGQGENLFSSAHVARKRK